MKQQQYDILIHFFTSHPKKLFLLRTANKCLSFSALLLYPVLLGWMLLEKDKRFLALFFCPAFAFTAMGVIRRLINRQRPYEAYGFTPLIKRDGKGESFPSRHVFSIFLIGTLWIPFFLPFALLLFICGCFLAAARVLGGVHYPGDVFCGALTGILCGVLTLFLC